MDEESTFASELERTSRSVSVRIFIKKCNKDAAGVKCIFIATPDGGKGGGGGSSSHVTLTIRGFLLTQSRWLFSMVRPFTNHVAASYAYGTYLGDLVHQMTANYRCILPKKSFMHARSQIFFGIKGADHQKGRRGRRMAVKCPNWSPGHDSHGASRIAQRGDKKNLAFQCLPLFKGLCCLCRVLHISSQVEGCFKNLKMV